MLVSLVIIEAWVARPVVVTSSPRLRATSSLSYSPSVSTVLSSAPSIVSILSKKESAYRYRPTKHGLGRLPPEMKLSASDAMPFSAACPGTVGRSRWTRRVPCLSRLTPLCVSLLFILCFLDVSLAQPDPVKDFCRRFGHQTAVIDRKLYIDGGFMNYNPLSQYPTNYSSM